MDSNALKNIYYCMERIIVFEGIDEVLQHIVQTAASLTRADAATLRLFNIETGELDIKAGSIMRVTASLSHFFGQIKLPRAGYTNVNLLQEYYVCLVMVDNLCNSFRSKEPVNADGPMHIVGKNPEQHDFVL